MWHLKVIYLVIDNRFVQKEISLLAFSNQIEKFRRF